MYRFAHHNSTAPLNYEAKLGAQLMGDAEAMEEYWLKARTHLSHFFDETDYYVAQILKLFGLVVRITAL